MYIYKYIWKANVGRRIETFVKAPESHNDCRSKHGTLDNMSVFERDCNNHCLTQF